MFDSRKKLIVPDLLADVQHRNGRINVSSSVIANFVFDRMTDDVLSNRYLENHGLNDIIFFNEKFEKIEGLDNKLYLNASGSDGRLINDSNPSEIDPASPPDSVENTKIEFTSFLTGSSPFTSRNVTLGEKTFLANYYFSYRPENYSSKILSRYNPKSLKLSGGSPHVAEISVNSNIKPTKSMLSGSTLSVTVPQVGSSDVTKNYTFLNFVERAKKSTQFLNFINGDSTKQFFSTEDGRKADFSISLADFSSPPVRKVFKVDSEAVSTFTSGSKTFVPNAGYDFSSRFNYFKENSDYEKIYASGSYFAYETSDAGFATGSAGTSLMYDSKVWLNFSISKFGYTHDPGSVGQIDSEVFNSHFEITGGGLNAENKEISGIQTQQVDMTLGTSGPAMNAVNNPKVIVLDPQSRNGFGESDFGSLLISEKMPGGSTLTISFFASRYQNILETKRSNVQTNGGLGLALEYATEKSGTFSLDRHSYFIKKRNQFDNGFEEISADNGVHSGLFKPGTGHTQWDTLLNTNIYTHFKITTVVPPGGRFYRLRADMNHTGGFVGEAISIFDLQYVCIANSSGEHTAMYSSDIQDPRRPIGAEHPDVGNFDYYNYPVSVSPLPAIQDGGAYKYFEDPTNLENVNGIWRNCLDFTDAGYNDAISLGNQQQWAEISGRSAEIFFRCRSGTPGNASSGFNPGSLTAEKSAAQAPNLFPGEKITLFDQNGNAHDLVVSNTAGSAGVTNGTDIGSGGPHNLGNSVTYTPIAGRAARAIGWDHADVNVTKEDIAILISELINDHITGMSAHITGTSDGLSRKIIISTQQDPRNPSYDVITSNLGSTSLNLPADSSKIYKVSNFSIKPLFFSCWVKPQDSYNAQANDEHFILSLNASANSDNLKLYVDANTGKLKFFVRHITSSLTAETNECPFGSWSNSNPRLSSSSWTHIAFCYNPNNVDDITFYVNGKLVSSTVTSASSGARIFAPMHSSQWSEVGLQGNRIGRRTTGATQITFKAKYTDIGIWNKVLSADQINELYVRGNSSYYSDQGLLSHLSLGENITGYHDPAVTPTYGFGSGIEDRISLDNIIGNNQYPALSDLDILSHVTLASPFENFNWHDLIGGGGSNKKFTFSVWIFHDGSGGSYFFAGILPGYINLFLTSDIIQYRFSHSANLVRENQLGISIEYGFNGVVNPLGNSTMEEWITRKVIPKNKWVHVAVSYDGNSIKNTPNLYIDGELQPLWDINQPDATASPLYYKNYDHPFSRNGNANPAEVEINGQTYQLYGSHPKISANRNGVKDGFKIAEPALWKTNLGSSEIQSIYQSTKFAYENTPAVVASLLSAAINEDSSLGIEAAVSTVSTVNPVVKLEQTKSLVQTSGVYFVTSSYPDPTFAQSSSPILYTDKSRRDIPCATFSNSILSTTLFLESTISDGKVLTLKDFDENVVNFTFETSSNPADAHNSANSIINIENLSTIESIRDKIKTAISANVSSGNAGTLSNITVSSTEENDIRLSAKPKSRFTIKCPNRDDADQSTIILTDTTGFSYSLFLRKSGSAAAPAGTIQVVLSTNPGNASDVATDLRNAINSLPTVARSGGNNNMNVGEAFNAFSSSENLTVVSKNFGLTPDPIGNNAPKFLIEVQFDGSEEYSAIPVSGTTISTGEISFNEKYFVFPVPEYNVPNTGQKILEKSFDGSDVVGPGDPRVGNTVVRYDSESSFVDIFNSLKSAISDKKNTGHAINGTKLVLGSAVVGPTLERKFSNSVLKESKTFLQLRNSDAVDSNNATGKGIISWVSGSFNLESKVPSLTIGSFSRGHVKSGAMTRNSSGLTHLGKKTILVRIYNNSSSGTGTIFTVSGKKTISGVDTDVSRWQLLSIDGNFEFRIRPNSSTAASDYWKATIDRSSLAKDKWYTLFITFDEAVFNVSDTSNFISLYDSENHGGLLSSSVFLVNGSAPTGNQSAKTIPARSPVEPRLFIGYGDTSSGIATNYSNYALRASNGTAQAGDFYDNFYLAELTILERKLTREEMSKIAESHLTLRTKSGFRNDLPKRLLNEKYQESRIIESSFKAFEESFEKTPVYESRDVIFPSGLAAGTTGSIDFSLSSVPANNSGFSIRLPDGKDFQVIFDTSSTTDDGFTLDEDSNAITDSLGIVAPLASKTRFKCGISGKTTTTAVSDHLRKMLSNVSRYSGIRLKSSRLNFNTIRIELEQPGSSVSRYADSSNPPKTSLCVVSSSPASNITVSNNNLDGQISSTNESIDFTNTHRKDSIVAGLKSGEVNSTIECKVSELLTLLENSNVTREYVEEIVKVDPSFPKQLVNVQNLPRERKDQEKPRRPAIEFTIQGVNYCARVDSKLDRRNSNKYNIGVKDVFTDSQLAEALANSINDSIIKDNLPVNVSFSGNLVTISLIERDSFTSRSVFSGQGIHDSIFKVSGFNPTFNPEVSEKSKENLITRKSSLVSKPFVDNGDIDIDEEFFAKGSYLSRFDEGFLAATRDRVRIEIPINPSVKTTLGFTTGSGDTVGDGFSAGNYNPIGYFNFDNKSWESISPNFSGKIETDRTASQKNPPESRDDAIKKAVSDFQKSAPIAFGGTYGFSVHRKDVYGNAKAVLTHYSSSISYEKTFTGTIRITSTDGTEIDYVLPGNTNKQGSSIITNSDTGFYTAPSGYLNENFELAAKDGGYFIGGRSDRNPLSLLMGLKAAIATGHREKISCDLDLPDSSEDWGTITFDAWSGNNSISNNLNQTVNFSNGVDRALTTNDILYVYAKITNSSFNPEIQYHYLSFTIVNPVAAGATSFIVKRVGTNNGPTARYSTDNYQNHDFTSVSIINYGIIDVDNGDQVTDAGFRRNLVLTQNVPGPAGNTRILNGLESIRVNGQVNSAVEIEHKVAQALPGSEVTIYLNDGVSKTFGVVNAASRPGTPSGLPTGVGVAGGGTEVGIYEITSANQVPATIGGAFLLVNGTHHVVLLGGRREGSSLHPDYYANIRIYDRIPHGTNLRITFWLSTDNIISLGTFSPTGNTTNNDLVLQYSLDGDNWYDYTKEDFYFTTSNVLNAPIATRATNSGLGRLHYEDIDNSTNTLRAFKIDVTQTPPGGAFYRLTKLATGGSNDDQILIYKFGYVITPGKLGVPVSGGTSLDLYNAIDSNIPSRYFADLSHNSINQKINFTLNGDRVAIYDHVVDSSTSEIVSTETMEFFGGTADIYEGKYSSFTGGIVSSKDDPNLSSEFSDLHYSELPLRGRPISNFGFPFSDTFKPSDGQKLDLSNYLDGPFLLEKFEIICSSSIRDEVQEGLGRLLPETSIDLPDSNYGQFDAPSINKSNYDIGNTDAGYYGLYDDRFRNLESQRLYDRYYPHSSNATGWEVLSFADYPETYSVGTGSIPACHRLKGKSTFTKEKLKEEGAYHRVGGNVYSRQGQFTSYIDTASDGVNVSEGVPWWRCDTFFLLRERPCIDTTYELKTPGAIKTSVVDATTSAVGGQMTFSLANRSTYYNTYQYGNDTYLWDENDYPIDYWVGGSREDWVAQVVTRADDYSYPNGQSRWGRNDVRPGNSFNPVFIEITQHNPVFDPSVTSMVNGVLYEVVIDGGINLNVVGGVATYDIGYKFTCNVADSTSVGLSAGTFVKEVNPKKIRIYIASSYNGYASAQNSRNYVDNIVSPNEVQKRDGSVRYAVDISSFYFTISSTGFLINAVIEFINHAIQQGYLDGFDTLDFGSVTSREITLTVNNANSKDFDSQGVFQTAAKIKFQGTSMWYQMYGSSLPSGFGDEYQLFRNSDNLYLDEVPRGASFTAPGAITESGIYEGLTISRPSVQNGVVSGFTIDSQSHDVTNTTRELISYAQVSYHGYVNSNSRVKSFPFGSNNALRTDGEIAHYYFVNRPGQLFFRGTDYRNSNSGSNKQTMEHPHLTAFGSFESTGSNGFTLLENGLGRELNIKIGCSDYEESFIDLPYKQKVVGEKVSNLKLSLPKFVLNDHQNGGREIFADDNSTLVVQETAAESSKIMFVNNTNLELYRSEINTFFNNGNLTGSYHLHDGVLNIRGDCKSTPRLDKYFSYRLAVLDQYDNPNSTSLPKFVNVSPQANFIGGYDFDGLGGTKSLSSVSGDFPSNEILSVSQMPFYLDDFDRMDPRKQIFESTYSDKLSTGNNFESQNAYVLEPKDKITLGFQTAVPGFHSGFTSMLNVGGGSVPAQLDDQGNLLTVHTSRVEIISISGDSPALVTTSDPHKLKTGNAIKIKEPVLNGVIQANLGNFRVRVLTDRTFELYNQQLSLSLAPASGLITPYKQAGGLAHTGGYFQIFEYVRSRALDSGKCIEATFSPYENSKLVLYGSYLLDDSPKHPKNKDNFSNSGVVFESIGQEDYDKFDLFLDSEFSGSMSSELVSKTNFSFALDADNSIDRNTVNVTFGQRTNDIGGSPKKLFATGSVERYMSISAGQDHDFVYWDSLPVDITPYFSSGLQRDRKIVPVKFLTSGSRAQLMSRQVGENTMDDSGVGLFIGSPNLSQVTYYSGNLQSLCAALSAFPTQTLSSSTTSIQMGSVEAVNLMGARVGAQVSFTTGLDNIVFEITGFSNSNQDLSVKFLRANPSNTSEVLAVNNPNCRIKVEHLTDIGSKLTGDNFSEYFFQDWRKRFIFEKTFRDENGVEQSVFGNSDFDPADSKLLSRNDANVTFGLDVESIDNFAAGFDNPVPSLKVFQSPNHNSGELVLSHKSTTPGIAKTYNLSLLGDKADAQAAIASIKSKDAAYQVRFDIQSSQIFASHPDLYSPAIYPDGVNQVDDSAYRQAAAILFGFGGEVNRNLETINLGSLSGTAVPYSVSFGQNIDDSADSDLILIPRASRQTLAHPKGVKYGMMNYDHIRPKVIFSRNSFGNFIDLIQGRKSAVYANVSNFDTSGEINADGRTVSVESKFFDANRALIRSGEDKLKFLFSQNLDRYQRSRSPFFDLPNPNIHTSAKGGRVRSESEITNNQVSVFNPDGNDIFDDFN